MPSQCCRCNGHGRCKSCKCVRDGAHCTNCTPGRSGRCENSSPTPSPSTATPLDSPVSGSTRGSGLSSEVNPGDDPSREPRLRNTAPGQESRHQDNPPAIPPQDPSPPPTAPPLAQSLSSLPSFMPMADPSFSWGSVDSDSFSHILSTRHMLKQSTGGKTASRCPTGKREKTLLPSLPDFTGPSPSVPPWNPSPLKPSLSLPS